MLGVLQVLTLVLEVCGGVGEDILMVAQLVAAGCGEELGSQEERSCEAPEARSGSIGSALIVVATLVVKPMAKFVCQKDCIFSMGSQPPKYYLKWSITQECH